MILQKAIASAVNSGVVFGATLPAYFVLDLDWWKVSCVILFFLYNCLLRHRCLGQVVARTYQSEPTSLLYAILYTASFATLLWWISVPFDIAFVNGLLVQLPCLLLYGNTLHGLATGTRTMTEREHNLERLMRGRCPDCDVVKLEPMTNSFMVYCKSCHASFDGNGNRLTMADGVLPTCEVIQLRA